MRKLFSFGILLYCITCMGSCDYDDSNDLDIITPNDSIDSKMILEDY